MSLTQTVEAIPPSDPDRQLLLDEFDRVLRFLEMSERGDRLFSEAGDLLRSWERLEIETYSALYDATSSCWWERGGSPRPALTAGRASPSHRHHRGGRR